ncbi:hypothetical protein H2198_008249 [Neophaeococcomyces mojaviensis]|uniref:Uncharacterized protein n=1 Tax=Neophaeococcomyces mojaviensis TaxID=3383035 RepID=A0ACC2ZXR0_9EURO|nr:hypothetical protein H2198_008249 [Knufia sp. JES_112]
MEPIKSSICRSCRLRLSSQTKARSFSTSSVRHVVPPESPYYVDIPTSYQPYLPWKPQPKGTLPVPRELFPASRPDKPSKEYLENVTQDKLEKNRIPEEKLTKLGKHKVKMAEVRKEQLREGLIGLHARKQAELKAMERRSQAKQLERNALIAQAEREDARLTNVSVPSALNPSPTTSLDALRAEVETAKQIHAQKVANYHNFTAAKHENKMDALHTLYMNARKFITTEKQLTQLIHEQFDTDSDADRLSHRVMHADFKTTTSKGDSMWNLGAPDSIKDMIADASGSHRGRDMFATVSTTDRFKKGQTGEKARFARDQERFKKIAEKLSGGKI